MYVIVRKRAPQCTVTRVIRDLRCFPQGEGIVLPNVLLIAIYTFSFYKL